jgi:hypothetical protein
MFRKDNVVVLMLAVMACSAPALAADEDSGSGLSVGVTGGTLGLGLEAGYRFSDRLGVRASAVSYTHDEAVDSDGFDIDGKARLKSMGAALDFYPFGGSFRLSAGLRSNKNRFSGVASPSGSTVEVGGDIYTDAQVGDLTGSARFKKTAPTLSVGWGGKFQSGLHFGIDLGVVLQGSPKLAASSNGTLAADPTFQDNLDDQLAEWQQDVDDEKYSKYWPIMQLHLAYRF